MQIDGAAIPTTGVVPGPSIYFKEGGQRVYLTADARIDARIRGQVVLSNFRTLTGAHAVHLVNGSDEGGANVPCDRESVPCVASGSKRTYIITWESVQLQTAGRPSPVITTARVGAKSENPPSLFANVPAKREINVLPVGISPAVLLNTFKNSPQQVRVRFEFGSGDFATNFIDRAISVEPLEIGGDVVGVVVDPGRDLPRRPEDYSVTVEFPAAELRNHVEPGFAIPLDEEFVKAGKTIDVNLFGLAPRPSDRAKTEFFFDSTFSSVVNSTNRKRSHVGLFALHLKPVVGLRFFNVDNDEKRPQWIAFRPLFDADVDTQPIKISQAPNRIVFGMDFEWGIANGVRLPNAAVQQYVFVNGLRYDSDRDFKNQTVYWHTEFMPQFRNWERTREQTLRQFRVPGGNRRPERARLQPFVSSYAVRPSVGYQLGGTVKRGDADTDVISRLFVKLGTAVEFKRLLQFSFEDTYYFLENADRRRNRNYLETRLDFNTGQLFSVDLGSLQSAFTVKFQRGELPPRFKPVNAFSLGFRLYR
jgi:hypothetical protein